MIFPFTIKIPANTDHDEYLGDFEIPEGVLIHIYIDIPAGWSLTSGIRFETEDGIQIPKETTLERYFTGDDSNLDFRYSPVYVRKGKIKVYGVNYDANDHYVTGYLEIMTPEEIALLRWINGAEVK